ncbi:hypothetical protein [Sphingomonas sp.]|uniref:hypothetical protein n=1 Tax=Sphingomonas sp. TaxID=28214 RepID=UPI002B737515|nr:hypothetical protein [Sphingomonas sp.]HWK36942.1 hypothetical protein [Sphingomonas sp.]
MANFLTKATLGIALGASAVVATATPAEAQRYNRGYRHHDSTGPAVVAGIAGLAIGAAIASNGNRRYDDRGYYDRGYYRGGYRDGYYRDRGYYNDGYYARRGYRGGYSCRVRSVYDPYQHRRVRVRYC